MSKLGGNSIANQPLTFDDTLVNNGRLKIEIDYSPTSGANISHTSLQDIGTNTHAQIDTHIADIANPHAVTKAQVGLSNVDNTSDLNKPVSTAQQTALNLKYDASNPSGYQTAAQVTSTVSAASTADRARANHTGTQAVGTITGLGALATKNTVATADIDNLAITSAKIGDAQVTSLKIADDAIVTARILSNSVTNPKLADMGANTLKGNNTAGVADPLDLTVSQVKTMLSINNVDNTSDASKPISTATQTALNLKYDASNPSGYETVAQLNTRDTNNRARANHTGTQTASTISDFAATVSAQITALRGAINGLASLDGGGKIPTTQLPAIAISDTFVVASQAAQVALTAEIGDIAIRTDLNKSYILRVNDPTVFANWQELLTPTDSVSSVNGQTGAVTLTTTNINEGSNLYFTTARVLATVITGVSFVTNSAILATDTVLQAFGKLQAQLTAVIAAVAGKENTITATTTADYYRGDKTFQPLNKAAVGLGNVDNTSDANKPISTATQTALNLKYDASNPSGYQTAAQVTTTVNAASTADRARANHTGTQTVSTISDFNTTIGTSTQTALNGKANLAGGNTFTGNQNFGAAAANIPAAPLNLVNFATGTALTQLNLINTGGGGGAGSAIDFHTYDVSGGTIPGARVSAIDDNFSAYLAFYTKTPGAPTNAINERMRISNVGDVTIGGLLGAALSNNPLSVNGTVNSFLQSNVQNTSAGTSASSDVIATADNGNDSTGFVNMGVNSSTYADPTFTINGPNDGYLYNQGGDLSIGTGSTNSLVIFTGGTLAANERARITATGQLALGVSAPNAASKLQIDSTTQGFLVPRMTSTQRGSIASPPAGLQVYDINLGALCTYSGAAWLYDYRMVVTTAVNTTLNTYGSIAEFTSQNLDIGLYSFELKGQAQSTAVGTGVGLRLAPVTATISTIGIGWSLSQAGAGTDKNFEYSQTATGDNITSTGVATANANFPVVGNGVFRITAVGTVAVQLRSEISASSVSIRADSIVVIKKVSA